MVRYNLLADPLEVAATIAHEMRTPLATIRNQSRILSRCLPDLLAGYQRAVSAAGEAHAHDGAVAIFTPDQPVHRKRNQPLEFHRRHDAGLGARRHAGA
jgi:signal transduction histidine kinase